MEKRTRYVSNYESGATFGYIDLWPLTRDDFFFYGSFYMLVFLLLLFFFSPDFSIAISSRLDLELWKWRKNVFDGCFEINSVK